MIERRAHVNKESIAFPFPVPNTINAFPMQPRYPSQITICARSSHQWCPLSSRLRLARTLAVAAHDLDLVGSDRLRVLHLEGDILDQESPDLVAESVGIEMTLCAPLSVPYPKHITRLKP